MENFDIFRNDLIRGISGTKNRPEKKAFYVEEKNSGIRVYIRIIVFIHNIPSSFLVVKTAWKNTVEPVKGGVEEQDIYANKDLLTILENGVRRETLEEAKIKNLDSLNYTGLYFQGKEKEYEENTYFQYHIFQASVSDSQIYNARKEFEYYKNNIKEWNELPKEYREKDGIAFYKSDMKIAGRWSPILVDFYLKNVLNRVD